MITIPDLQTALLDLLYELQDTDIQLIIGGGYGIYLKADYVRRRGVRSLLQEWPEPRSTNDLDLFLRPELLIGSMMLTENSVVITPLIYIQFWRQRLRRSGGAALKFRDQHGEHPYVVEAGHLVSKYFSAFDRVGMIRLQESPYYRPELQLEEFISALQELFPAKVELNNEGK